MQFRSAFFAVIIYGLVPLAGATITPPAGSARLHARPMKPTEHAATGLHSLGFAGGHDGILSVPANYTREKPIPLILMLHYAGGHAGLEVFCDHAAKEGIAVVMPESRGRTWDLLLNNSFGPDIQFIDRALQYTFAHVAIDPRHIAVAGLSDGASYALSVGLANGDLFTHIIAYSPGEIEPSKLIGWPLIYITHGTSDRILPITVSRQFAPVLRKAGYKVIFREFDGGHYMKRALVMESLRWFLEPRAN